MSHQRIALQHHAQRAGAFPVELVVEEGDLVTVVHHELRTGGRDHVGFRTVRIDSGAVVEEWSNEVPGSTPGRAVPDRSPSGIGPGTPREAKQLVSDFYRCVFDAHDPGAVADFVHEDYLQHSGHLPRGRAGLEGLVAAMFPDGPVPTPDQPLMPPSILMGQGDVVVIAAAVPQPDGVGGTWLRYLYDGYRVRDGLLGEHWSGVDPDHPPGMG